MSRKIPAEDIQLRALGDLAAFHLLSIQLLIVALERQGALDRNGYADLLSEYLASDEAKKFDAKRTNALLGDLLYAVTEHDD